jgi:hypothetical protein
MKRHPFLAGACLASAIGLAGFAAPLPLAAADPFYLDLLRDGGHAFDRGDHATAVRHLRLACFGMLDEPKMLGECLSRLALAQDKAGDVDGFHETFSRLVEVEERFQGYSQAAQGLTPAARTALEQRVAALIPAPTLARSPAVFRTARRPELSGGGGGVQATEPKSDRPQPPAERSAAPPAATVTATPPAPSPASSPGPVTAAERTKMETARQLLGQSSKVRELRQAFQLAGEVADVHPDSREAQQLAGEAAYRVSRWKEAADYLRRNGGPDDDQPELLFYLAVALYEAGDPQAAAGALRRSLPNLQRTPYVDGYSRKILGE